MIQTRAPENKLTTDIYSTADKIDRYKLNWAQIKPAWLWYQARLRRLKFTFCVYRHATSHSNIKPVTYVFSVSLHNHYWAYNWKTRTFCYQMTTRTKLSNQQLSALQRKSFDKHNIVFELNLIRYSNKFRFNFATSNFTLCRPANWASNKSSILSSIVPFCTGPSR